MNNFLYAAYFANVLLCLLFGLRMLAVTSLLPGRLLGINYLLYAGQYGLGLLAFGLGWELAAHLRALGATLIGPLMYFYYRSVTQTKQVLIWRDTTHIILPMLCLALMLLHNGKLLVISGLFVDELIIASFGIYLVLAIFQMYKGWESPPESSRPSLHAFYWLSVLTVLMIVNLAIEIAAYIEIQSGIPPRELSSAHYGAWLFLLANAITIFLAMIRSPLLEWMDHMGGRLTQKTSVIKLDELQAQELYNRWDKMVITQNLFQADSGIDIKTAARKLGVPIRHLSEAINRVYGASFSQHLNQRRIQHAAILLKNNPEHSISDILLEAGFSTKSNFNKEFLRVMKMSPSDYRKRCRLE